MKATIKDLKITIGLRGHAGHMNGSYLELETSMGKIIPHPKGWDLNPLKDVQVYGGILKIPSGKLQFYSSSLYCCENSIIIQTGGIWDGKTAGLTGGMSGFGVFTEANTTVWDGQFLFPVQKALEIGTEPVPLAQYCARRAKVGTVESFLREDLRHKAWNSPIGLRLQANWVNSTDKDLSELVDHGPPEEEELFLFWWWDLLKSVDEIPVEEIRERLFPAPPPRQRRRRRQTQEILEYVIDNDDPDEYDEYEYED